MLEGTGIRMEAKYKTKIYLFQKEDNTVTYTNSIGIVYTPLCNRPSGIFIFTGFLEKTSLGWPISHWVGLFSGRFFFIRLFDTKMASCRK